MTFNIDTLNKQDVARDREGQHLFVNKFWGLIIINKRSHYITDTHWWVYLNYLSHSLEKYLQRLRWCNGLARLQQWSCYLQGPGFKFHLWPVEFFTSNTVSLLNNRIQTLWSVPQLSNPRLSGAACKTSNQTNTACESCGTLLSTPQTNATHP